MRAAVDELRSVGRRGAGWVLAGGQQRMWTLWGLLRLFGITVVFLGLTRAYSNTWGPLSGDVIYDYAAAHAAILSGHLPYRDFLYEYPPGTIPYVAIPLARGDNSSWLLTFSVEMLVLDALVLRALARSALPHRQAAQLMWVAGGVLTWGLFLERNDLEAVVPVVLGLLALMAERRSRAMGWLVLGVFTKIWPVLLIATAVISRPRLLRPAAIATAIATAVFVMPIVALGGVGDFWHDLVGYHGRRGVEIEAVVALPSLFTRTLMGSGRHPGFVTDFGSVNIVNSGVLATVATIATAAAVAVVLGRLVMRRRREGPLPMATVLQAGCLLIALCLLTTKVLSPQYFSWLLGVSCVAFAAGVITRRDATVVLVVLALTGIEYPLLFWHLGTVGSGALLGETAMLARAVLLVTLVVHWAPGVFSSADGSTGPAVDTNAVPTLVYR